MPSSKLLRNTHICLKLTVSPDRTRIMLSNLHSFHFGALLQNASALPWHVYQSTTNKLLLTPPASITTKPNAAVTMYLQPPSKKNHQRTTKPATKPLTTRTGKSDYTKLKSKAKPKWKPGPGVIEKVDKTSGEIMHLSTE